MKKELKFAGQKKKIKWSASLRMELSGLTHSLPLWDNWEVKGKTEGWTNSNEQADERKQSRKRM